MPNYLVNVNGDATYEFGQYFKNNETWTKGGGVVTEGRQGRLVGRAAGPPSLVSASRGLAVCAAARTRLLVGHTLRGGESTLEQ